MTKTYTAHFRTSADYATQEFKASTPEKALALARAFEAENAGEFDFQEYDGGHPINEIEVFDPDGTPVARWHDDDLRLDLAASELLEALEAQTDAAQDVIDRWEKGDLAGAVRALGASIAPARAALAKAKVDKS